MTQPLALVFYEKLLPGTQVVNRLQDLGYRVQTIPGAGMLVSCAQRERPLVILADLESSKDNVCEAIASLKRNPETQHLPVIAFSGETRTEAQSAARQAGANMVVNESAILSHLNQVLDQALQIE